MHFDDSSSSDSEIDDLEIDALAKKNANRYRPVKGVPELSYRVNSCHGLTVASMIAQQEKYCS